MKKFLFSIKNLKRCCYLLVFLVLLQYFLYYTRKYNFSDFSAEKQQIKLLFDPQNKIDWENTSFIQYEASRVGPGEQGKPYKLTDPDEIKQNEEYLKKEGFYVLVSDKISQQRALPDHRPRSCKHKKYLKKLPKVSVIITFHNEVWSVLLRCIHSIYNRSPPELLHEIILVNDKSTFEELYGPLKKLVTGAFEGKIKIHDNEKREGLIKARMIGAKLAEAEVIIFLDSHMEVTNTWLPPLLEPIVYNPTYATVPLVEGMNHATFEYEFIGHGYRGTFDWNFRYQWIPFREERADPGQNYNLSSMTGGAYAIRKEHFFYLGGYDEELKIWNGENYELSLKLWLCSGGIFTVPCSRIVHLSKLHSAYRDLGDGSDFVGRNLKRVAEVWLDGYKQYFYRNDLKRYSKIDAGNLTEQFKRKEMLKCKPFKYFLDEIAPEMLLYYPIEPQYFAAFSIQHMSSLRCISLNKMSYHERLILSGCNLDLANPPTGTGFKLTFEKSIRYNDTNDQCLNGNTLALSNCHHAGYEQHWVFNLDSRQIYQAYEKKCLAGSDTDDSLTLELCDDSLLSQKWRWGYENITALMNWDKTGIKVN